LSRAKFAVTEISAVTLVSVLGFEVELSLQLTKEYPESGTAVTAVPLLFLHTYWVVVPVKDPLLPAVYVRVYFSNQHVLVSVPHEPQHESL